MLQSSGHKTGVAAEPQLGGDPRAILSDPLTDRTSEASAQFEREQQAEAEKNLHAAMRDVWLATAQHSETVRAERLLDADRVAEQISLDPAEENVRARPRSPAAAPPERILVRQVNASASQR